MCSGRTLIMKRACPSIGIILAFLFLSGHTVLADCNSNNPPDCSYVSVGSTTPIQPTSPAGLNPSCMTVVNNCSSDIMVPYASQGEWSSFYNNHESCANISLCSFTWNVTTWGSCTLSCGAGTQTATVYDCLDNGGTVVSNSFCGDSAPTRSCNTQACPGVCGSSLPSSSLYAPSTSLCNSGSPSAVTINTGGTGWTWTCGGTACSMNGESVNAIYTTEWSGFYDGVNEGYVNTVNGQQVSQEELGECHYWGLPYSQGGDPAGFCSGCLYTVHTSSDQGGSDYTDGYVGTGCSGCQALGYATCASVPNPASAVGGSTVTPTTLCGSTHFNCNLGVASNENTYTAPSPIEHWPYFTWYLCGYNTSASAPCTDLYNNYSGTGYGELSGPICYMFTSASSCPAWDGTYEWICTAGAVSQSCFSGS